LVKAPPSSSPFWKAWEVLTRFNVVAYRLTGGRVGGSYAGAPILLLHHVGARSGKERVGPLLSLAAGDDRVGGASQRGTGRRAAGPGQRRGGRGRLAGPPGEAQGVRGIGGAPARRGQPHREVGVVAQRVLDGHVHARVAIPAVEEGGERATAGPQGRRVGRAG